MDGNTLYDNADPTDMAQRKQASVEKLRGAFKSIIEKVRALSFVSVTKAAPLVAKFGDSEARFLTLMCR